MVGSWFLAAGGLRIMNEILKWMGKGVCKRYPMFEDVFRYVYGKVILRIGLLCCEC